MTYFMRDVKNLTRDADREKAKFIAALIACYVIVLVAFWLVTA